MLQNDLWHKIHSDHKLHLCHQILSINANTTVYIEFSKEQYRIHMKKCHFRQLHKNNIEKMVLVSTQLQKSQKSAMLIWMSESIPNFQLFYWAALSPSMGIRWMKEKMKWRNDANEDKECTPREECIMYIYSCLLLLLPFLILNHETRGTDANTQSMFWSHLNPTNTCTNYWFSIFFRKATWHFNHS